MCRQHNIANLTCMRPRTVCATQQLFVHAARPNYARFSNWAILLKLVSCNARRQCPWGSYQPKSGQCGCLPCTGTVSPDHTQCCESSSD